VEIPVKNMPADLWLKVLKSVRGRVPEGTFNTWFAPLKPVHVSGCQIRVVAPNPLFIEWIEKHYGGLFVEVGRDLNLPDLLVELLETPAEDLVLAPPALGKSKESKASAKRSSEPSDLGFNPLYRFEAFVEGPSNRFAYAACKAVAQSPSKAYNPLYVYGGVGLGKTHLMQSIGHFMRDHFPALKVSYLSAERFMNEMISAIGNKSTPDFRNRYRQMDVLLLDDVQFLANKTGTQEEIFHTFNALHEARKQIVISSDCPPRDLQSIEERLRSRFEWGLIADIQPPELETKVAILYKKAEAYHVKLPEDVALFVASRIKTNIRELEGCLVRLIAMSSFRDLPINLDLAHETLHTLFREDGRSVTAEGIQKQVAAYFRMKVQDLKSSSHKAQVVLPRQVAMYLCKELTGASLPEIGRKFGGKHHTTVLHSIRKVEQKMASDPQFQQQIHTFMRSFC
jgi:chromosomal replication initiator protein